MDDTPFDLSPPDRNALTVLVNEYGETEEPVKSKRLAERIDRTEGSLKNQMRKLGSLGLVDSVPGPRGGYEPTEMAFRVLDRDRDDDQEDVVLAQNFQRLDVTVDGITLTNVHHPTECRARIHFQQLLEDIEVGDPIVVGPTPEFDLVVLGEVTDVLGAGDEILLDVGEMQAPFTDA
ncbi:Rrf2 family transcriptional regulator [Halorhabdus amylolytica]|uniref:Rrf2 family transcriptional regulator n=1 Tax=Halorhabdus amylolytica TaxID=2559573 RepID=UPI0010AB08E7|nr:Rrf2 family transcriptional regulator [Halorhabdus amylolytica]